MIRRGNPKFSWESNREVNLIRVRTIDGELPPIVLVWHIFSSPEVEDKARSIVKRQLDLIVDSGLMDRITEIKLGLVGSGALLEELPTMHPKISVLVKADKGYEGVTMNALRHWVDKERGERFVLYIHNRGVGHAVDSPTWSWTKMMEYFMIERHEECTHALRNHVTTGCEMFVHHEERKFSRRAWGMWHYAGNFWWARASYVRFLPHIETWGIDVNKHEVSEDWILYEANHKVPLDKFHVMHHTTAIPHFPIYERHYPRTAYERKRVSIPFKAHTSLTKVEGPILVDQS